MRGRRAGSAAILAVAASKPTVTVDAAGRIGVERQMKAPPPPPFSQHPPAKEQDCRSHCTCSSVKQADEEVLSVADPPKVQREMT